MAVINIYEDLFAETPKHIEMYGGKSVRNIVEDYLNALGDDSKVYEVYNVETGETEYKALSVSSYKIVVSVNNKEENLDYIIEENDLVTLVFVPEKLNNWQAGIASQAGGFLSAIGGIVVMFPGWGRVIGGALIAIGAGLEVWAGLSTKANAKDKKKHDDSLNSESNLSINGGGNQPITGNRYPFVMGKHLTNPQIVGSAYNTTYTKNFRGEDGGQYITQLYCLGYAPLKVTNFKIGDVWCSYNATTGEGEARRVHDTIMHGQLHGVSGTEDDDGDILNKWKNNDLTIEILQKGNLAINDVDRYGTLYPQACKQTEVNANILKIQDGIIADVANRVYKGCNVPNEFQSNSVRFTGSCPKRIEVELDFPQGLYATRTKSGDDGSKVYYYNLPNRFAIQWRFVREGQPSSNALSPDGWNNFDYIDLSEPSASDITNKRIYPKKYTLGKKIFDYKSNLGKTGYLDFNKEDSVKDFTSEDSWLYNGYGFEFGTEQEPEHSDETSASDTYFLYGEYYTSTGILKKSKKGWKEFEEDVYERFEAERKTRTISKSNPFIIINEFGTEDKFWDSKIVPSWINEAESIYNSTDSITDYPNSGSTFEKKYGVNERRYVVVKEFTEEECRQLVNFQQNEKVSLDCVEVRVIRITPSYFDQTGDQSKWSNMTYQDLCKWTTLRTFSFDKDKYLEALKGTEHTTCYSSNGKTFYSDENMTNEISIPAGMSVCHVSGNEYYYDSISVDNFPQRPQSEEDMDKFVYVALRLKQDVAETGGSSLNEFSMVVESMGPKYSKEDDIWYPETISETFKYYSKDSSSGETKITTYANEELYNLAKKEAEEEGRTDIQFIKSKKGNDLVPQLKNEIFTDETCITPDTGKTIQISVSGEMSAKNDGTISGHYEQDEWDDDVYIQDYKNTLIGNSFKINSIPADEDVKDIVAKDLVIEPLTSEDSSWIVGNPTVIEVNKSLIEDEDVTVNPKAELFTTDWNTEGFNSFPGGQVKYTLSVVLSKRGGEVYPFTIEGTFDFKTVDYKKTSTLPFSNENISTDIHFPTKYKLSTECEEKYVTANVSAVAVNALVGPYLGVEAKTYDSINMQSATEMYEFCEDVTDGTPDEKEEDGLKHFTYKCNGIVSQEVKLESLIQKILITGRANLKRDEENKYEFIIGKPVDYPIILLNQQNCISRSNTRSFQEVPSGLQINFVDETDNWGNNDIYIMDDGEDYKNPTKEIESYSFQYVTDREQIWSLGRFNLGCRIFQREQYNRDVGKIGYLLSFGDKVLLQDETLLVGTDNGAHVQKLIESTERIYGFVTDEPFYYTGETEEVDGITLSKQGCTVMQADKAGNSRCVTMRLAKPNTIESIISLSKFEKPQEFRYAATIVNKDVYEEGSTIIIAKEYYIYNDVYYCYDGAQLFTFDMASEKTLSITYTNRNDIELSNVEKVDIYKQEVGLTNIVLFQYPIIKKSETSEEFDGDAIRTMVKPAVYDLVAFGYIDSITIEAIITSVKPKEKETFSLTLAPYDSKLYNMGKEMVEFKSRMTNPVRELTNVEFTDKITQDVVNENVVKAQAEIEDTLSGMQESIANLESDPTVYTSITTCGVAVNDNDIVTQEQTVSIKYYVRQGSIDLDFYFATDKFKLPSENYKFSIDGNVLTLIIPKDEVVTTEILNLPIMFRAYEYNLNYGDENEIGYSPKLEGDDPDYYGFRKLSGKETLYDVGFTLIGVQGGRYHGAVTEINENEILVVTKEEKDETGETVYITEPMDVNTLILGDYITYIGSDTETDLVEGGSLTTSTLYEWVGKSSDRLYMWKQDVMSEHCGGSLSDALAVSNESLAKNNSTAFQFLDHLTANSIFVNRLVANDAFIKNLFVKQIELQTEYNSDGTVKQYGAIYGGNRYNADGTINRQSPVDAAGFHISANGVIQSNKAIFNRAGIENATIGNTKIQKANIEYSFLINNYSFTLYEYDDTSELPSKLQALYNNIVNELQITSFDKVIKSTTNLLIYDWYGSYTYTFFSSNTKLQILPSYLYIFTTGFVVLYDTSGKSYVTTASLTMEYEKNSVCRVDLLCDLNGKDISLHSSEISNLYIDYSLDF